MRKLIQTQRELKTKLKIQKSHKFVREKNHSNSPELKSVGYFYNSWDGGTVM